MCVWTAVLLPADLKTAQKQAEIIVMVIPPVGIHILYLCGQSGMGGSVNRKGKNQNLGIGKPLEGAVIRGLPDKTAPDRVIGMPPAKGVHGTQIGSQAEGGVVILLPGEELDEPGQEGAGLADNDVDVFLVLHSGLLAEKSDCILAWRGRNNLLDFVDFL